jgi:hypothetical protein
MFRTLLSCLTFLTIVATRLSYSGVTGVGGLLVLGVGGGVGLLPCKNRSSPSSFSVISFFLAKAAFLAPLLPPLPLPLPLPLLPLPLLSPLPLPLLSPLPLPLLSPLPLPLLPDFPLLFVGAGAGVGSGVGFGASETITLYVQIALPSLRKSSKHALIYLLFFAWIVCVDHCWIIVG